MASLLQFIDLFNQAQEKNPLASTALPAARDELIPPPPPKKISLSSGEDIAPFDPKFGEEKPEALSGPSPTEKGKGLLDWGALGGGLAQAAGLGLTRLIGGEEVAEGYGKRVLQDIQQRQAEGLRRRQSAWEDAYKQVGELPSSIYNDERFKELSDAANAIRKDLADGKIDNEKSLGAFLTAKSKYQRDIEQASAQQEYEKQKAVEDQKQKDELQRHQQAAIRAREIVSNPEIYPPEVVQQAQSEIAMYDQALNAQKLRESQAESEKLHWAAQEEASRASAGRAEEGLNLQRQRLGLSQQNAGHAAAAKAIGNSARAVDRDIQGRLRIAAQQAAKSLDPTGFDYDSAYKEALKANHQSIRQATGLQVIMPEGNDVTEAPVAIIMGQQVPLNFDPSSPEGSLQLLKMAYDAMQSYGNQDLTLSGAFGEE